MPTFKETEGRGQALVEFALIVGVLLLIIFIVIEAGHLLQANLTVQNAARAAGRYAITGQFETDCLTDTPPCDDPRVFSIEQVAREELAGLPIDDNAVFEEPGYVLVEVFGTDAAGNLIPDSAGMPGRPIIVRVSYRAAIWTPLLRPIADTVMVTGQTVMNNEKVVQANTAGDASAPPVPAPPAVAPTPMPPPDLVLTKTGPASVIEGSDFNYNLVVTNDGDREATNVVLTDDLPVGVTFNDVDPSAECALAGTTVTCNWPSLAVSAVENVRIGVKADSVAAGNSITNTATVALAENDQDPSDNSDEVVTDIVPSTTETDLEVIKTGPESAPVSTESDTFTAEYEVVVVNRGPNDASDIEVHDTLPVGMAFVSSTGGCDATNAPTIVCSVASLANGESHSWTIEASTPDSKTIVTNVATLQSVTPNDINSANNTSSAETEIRFLADLEIVKTGSPSTLYAGELLTYTIEVWNSPSSPHDATGVNIFDALPLYVELEDATYTRIDGGTGTCDLSGNSVSCPIGPLPADGTRASAVIHVRPQRGGTIINSAQVSGFEDDPDTINSSAAVTLVDALSDLSIRKEVTPTTIFAGDLITYTLTVTNGGPSLATGVTVEDQLPAEVVYQFAESDFGSCDWAVDIRRVTCSLGSLPADAVVTIHIGVVPVVPQVPIENVGTISGSEEDPNADNDSSVVTVAQLGNPFLLVQPACGPTGTVIQIDGYLWSDKRDVALYWLDQAGNRTLIEAMKFNNISKEGRFTRTYTVPEEAYKGTFEIEAQQESATGDIISDTATVRVPCPAPDLEVTGLTPLSSNAVQYATEPITYTATIENTGNRPANDQFFVGLYAFSTAPVSTTTHLDVSNRLDVVAVSGLAAGGSTSVTLVADSGFAITGTQYVYAFVDSDPGPSGTITEMYETNNLSAEATVTVSTATVDPPSPPPTGTIQLSGQTYISDVGGEGLLEQPLVKVSIYGYTTTDKIWLATTYSDLINSEYRFTGLPSTVSGYYVTASVTVDGVVYRFDGDVALPTQTLVLYPQ